MANLIEPIYTHFPVVPIQSTSNPGPATFERSVGTRETNLTVRVVKSGISDAEKERELVRLRSIPASLATEGASGPQ